MAWTEHKRSDTGKVAGTKFISLRPMGIAFSANFVESSPDVRKASRASIVVDAEGRRLGFRFHRNEDDPNAYSLCADGGGANGKWIQARRLYTDYEWLGRAVDQPAGSRRFLPEFDAKSQVWFIRIPDRDMVEWAKRRVGK
jgi:hypothetical protein